MVHKCLKNLKVTFTDVFTIVQKRTKETLGRITTLLCLGAGWRLAKGLLPTVRQKCIIPYLKLDKSLKREFLKISLILRWCFIIETLVVFKISVFLLSLLFFSSLFYHQNVNSFLGYFIFRFMYLWRKSPQGGAVQ